MNQKVDQKVNNFDVLKELGRQNIPSFKGFFGENLTNVRTGKDGWGAVTIAVDNATAHKIMTDHPIILMLVVADRADFERVKAELATRPENVQAWTERTDDVFEAGGLFVRCKDGYMTSGFCDHGTWWVYDHKRGECHPESPTNKVTHFCKRPPDRPWVEKLDESK